MTEPPHGPEVEELYHAALARPADEREAFLIGACAGRPELLGEVRSLLRYAEEAGRILMRPAAQAATAPLGLVPGTRLGRYEVREPIGAGGMGEVYRARDTRLGRDVAVKVLPGERSGNEEARSRFELDPFPGWEEAPPW